MIRSFFNLLFPKKVKLWLGFKYSQLYAWTVGYDPKKCMSHFYKSVFHQPMNWENPQNLIEKINWLQLNTDTSLWTLCADKFRVREYVRQKGCGEYLNELYGMWEDADSVDFSQLPNKFVLKANHGCGEVLLVKDKSKLDIPSTKKLMNKWLKEKYGRINGQTHYTRIKPCIIAEKLLENPQGPDKPIVDYKFWCFHGKPEVCMVCYNRSGHYTSLSLFDLKWNNISASALVEETPFFGGAFIQRPEALDKMVEIAKILSRDFYQVRIDFYSYNKEPIIGELTFTTGYGYFKTDFYNRLGDKINLPCV